MVHYHHAGFGITYVTAFAFGISADGLNHLPSGFTLRHVSAFRSSGLAFCDEDHGFFRRLYVLIYHSAIRIFKPDEILDQFDFLQVRGISPLYIQIVATRHLFQRSGYRRKTVPFLYIDACPCSGHHVFRFYFIDIELHVFRVSFTVVTDIGHQLLEFSVAEVYFFIGFDDESVVCSAPTCRIFIVFGIFVRVFFRIFRNFYRPHESRTVDNSGQFFVSFHFAGPWLQTFLFFWYSFFVEFYGTQVSISDTESQPYFLFTGRTCKTVFLFHVFGKHIELVITESSFHPDFIERDGFFRSRAGAEYDVFGFTIRTPTVGKLHTGSLIGISVCSEINLSQSDNGVFAGVTYISVSHVKRRVCHQFDVFRIALHERDKQVAGSRLRLFRVLSRIQIQSVDVGTDIVPVGQVIDYI